MSAPWRRGRYQFLKRRGTFTSWRGRLTEKISLNPCTCVCNDTISCCVYTASIQRLKLVK
jgi:hypothetical protein